MYKIEKFCIFKRYLTDYYWLESGTRYYFPVSGRLYKEESILLTRRFK